MHVHHLAIPFRSAHDGRHEHERLLGHEIPYASFIPCAVAGVGLEIEFQSQGDGKESEA